MFFILLLMISFNQSNLVDLTDSNNIPEVKEEIPIEENIITNHTDDDKIEEFITIGLNELGVSNINLIVLPISILPQHGPRSDINALVDVEKINDELTVYRLYIDHSRSWFRVTKTLSHELIHILQHYEKRIKRKNEKYIFEGKSYTESFPYRMRPWEAEAFNNSPELRKTILSKIKSQ